MSQEGKQLAKPLFTRAHLRLSKWQHIFYFRLSCISCLKLVIQMDKQGLPPHKNSPPTEGWRRESWGCCSRGGRRRGGRSRGRCLPTGDLRDTSPPSQMTIPGNHRKTWKVHPLPGLSPVAEGSHLRFHSPPPHPILPQSHDPTPRPPRPRRTEAAPPPPGGDGTHRVTVRLGSASGGSTWASSRLLQTTFTSAGPPAAALPALLGRPSYLQPGGSAAPPPPSPASSSSSSAGRSRGGRRRWRGGRQRARRPGGGMAGPCRTLLRSSRRRTGRAGEAAGREGGGCGPPWPSPAGAVPPPCGAAGAVAAAPPLCVAGRVGSGRARPQQRRLPPGPDPRHRARPQRRGPTAQALERRPWRPCPRACAAPGGGRGRGRRGESVPPVPSGTEPWDLALSLGPGTVRGPCRPR